LYKATEVLTSNYIFENRTMNWSDTRKTESAKIKFAKSVARFIFLHFKILKIRDQLNISNLNEETEKQTIDGS
jgi:hypothetical protein